MPAKLPVVADEVFAAFFDLSLTGGILFEPVRDAAGEVVDLAYLRLNLAAQRMLALPALPTETFLARYPHAQQAGIFAFCREAFLSGEVRHANFNYQHDGLDNYYHVAAQPWGNVLLVSFTDTSDQERSAVELALRESQAREQAARQEAENQRQQLYQVLMQLPANVAVQLGPDHVFTLVNPSYQRLAADRQLMGRPIREAWPELNAAGGILDVLNRVYRTGEPYYGTEVDLQVDFNGAGQLKQLYLNAAFLPLRDAQGRIEGVLDFSYDVTEQVLARRRVEQLNQELEARVRERTRQLAEQQQLLQEILVQLPAAIATLSGPEHRFSFTNDTYRTIVGGRARIGQPVAEVLPELVAQGFIARLNQVYATREPFIGHEIPLQLYDATGQPQSLRYLDFVYRPLLDGQDRPTGILVFAVDVTEKVLARQQTEALQAAMLAVAQRQAQQREDLYQVFEQTPAAILLLRGANHRIEYANPAYARFFPGVALRGRLLIEAHPGAAASGTLQRLDQVYATGETFTGQELPVRLLLVPGQPPQTRYFTFTYQPYRENGHTTGISVVAFETTEQALTRQQVQRLNEELQDTNAHLVRTNADLDTFVYTASHDLKAPITNIEGLLVALRDYLPAEANPMVPRLLAMMDGAVARFLQTIGHLTDVSRLQHAAHEPAEAVPLAKLVNDICLDLGPLIETTGAELRLELDTCSTVYFPPKNLRSIVYNLLSNALKYRDPNRAPVVWVRAYCTPAHTLLEVQDNGLGLSPEQQAGLFGLFKRLHTHVEGTGVGLYMLKKIVENAGGTIGVQSEPGVGSTFTVSLPLLKKVC